MFLILCGLMLVLSLVGAGLIGIIFSAIRRNRRSFVTITRKHRHHPDSGIRGANAEIYLRSVLCDGMRTISPKPSDDSSLRDDRELAVDGMIVLK